jgi:hypothetical protein
MSLHVWKGPKISLDSQRSISSKQTRLRGVYNVNPLKFIIFQFYVEKFVFHLIKTVVCINNPRVKTSICFPAFFKLLAWIPVASSINFHTSTRPVLCFV